MVTYMMEGIKQVIESSDMEVANVDTALPKDTKPEKTLSDGYV